MGKRKKIWGIYRQNSDLTRRVRCIFIDFCIKIGDFHPKHELNTSKPTVFWHFYWFHVLFNKNSYEKKEKKEQTHCLVLIKFFATTFQQHIGCLYQVKKNLLIFRTRKVRVTAPLYKGKKPEHGLNRNFSASLRHWNCILISIKCWLDILPLIRYILRVLRIVPLMVFCIVPGVRYQWTCGTIHMIRI